MAKDRKASPLARGHGPASAPGAVRQNRISKAKARGIGASCAYHCLIGVNRTLTYGANHAVSASVSLSGVPIRGAPDFACRLIKRFCLLVLGKRHCRPAVVSSCEKPG